MDVKRIVSTFIDTALPELKDTDDYLSISISAENVACEVCSKSNVSTPSQQPSFVSQQEDMIALVLKDRSVVRSPEPFRQYSLNEVLGVLVRSSLCKPFILHPRSCDRHQWGNKEALCSLPKEADAIWDGDGKMNTERMLLNGSSAAAAVKQLGGDWYIPSLGELLVVCRYQDEINNLLRCIEASDLLEQLSIWSSTEYDSLNAWNVRFNNGNSAYSNKCNAFVVRPVVAF